MTAHPSAADWMAARGWMPFDFQREVWAAMARGASGLLHATTGAGKTYAVWLGLLQALRSTADRSTAPPLTVLWITPMRALAADTLRALQAPLPDMAPHWSAGVRSGDTPTGERAAQNRRLPTVLVTTPESLSLLLARADAPQALGRVQAVVVDEWHELLGNKRGVQVQLALARLRRWQPRLCVWGMSATLGNVPDALQALLGPQAAPQGVLVRGQVPKTLVVDTLLPDSTARFPWAGHLGLTMLPQVVREIERSATTLVFTNTRSQAEIWYQALLEARPDWAGELALHHGSLDKAVRDWVEQGLKAGGLRAVVCTSSLDLGVDFLPVERVLQIGSPKGVARLLQRAGRSGHAPGRPSRVTLVPTHSLELIEAAAARDAVAQGQVESRTPPTQPLDVLVQHLVTVALGGGFTPDALLEEVRHTAAYAGLTDDAWQWCLDFVSKGGDALAAYPDYRRVVPDDEGLWRVPDARLARRHRANIGTIVSDASMSVQFVGGAKLGQVEESFAARLKPGDCFLFAGRLLELVRIREMTAWVKRASGNRPAVPRWNGGRMPLSTELGDAMLARFDAAQQGQLMGPEMQAVAALLQVQARWSALPGRQVLLAEVLQSREGTHLYLYPFAGRHVHLGLASLLAWRVARHTPATFSMAVNDYGLELLSATPVDWPAQLARVLQPVDDATLWQEVMDSLNASELAQRRFRDIARVAGLVFQSHPGEQRSSRQLQASSSLFWEVFRQYDPGNRLLGQAEHELLAQELDWTRLQATLLRLHRMTHAVHVVDRATPLSFPLMVERLREKLSNESLADRIARMVAQLEDAAGGATWSVPSTEAVRQNMAFGRESAIDDAPRPPRTARTRARRR